MPTGAVLTLGLALLVSACTTSTRPDSGPHETASGVATDAASRSPTALAAASTAARPFGAPRCRPPTPIQPSANGLPEVHGTARQGQLWGLLFLRGSSIRAGDEVKVVWRMTGHGALSLTATAPNGMREPLAWGPEAHQDSNYQRPGDEWGAGYRFPQAGCWTLHATRADTLADVWVAVSR